MQAFRDEVFGYSGAGCLVIRVIFYSGGTQDPSPAAAQSKEARLMSSSSVFCFLLVVNGQTQAFTQINPALKTELLIFHRPAHSITTTLLSASEI